MSIPCAPIINCVDPPNSQLFSLEDPPLPNVTCPQGAQSNTVTISCCGQQTVVSVAGMTPTQRRDAINNAVNACVLSLAFCGVAPPSQLFGNNPQVGQTTCPDGTIFGVANPGCSFIATSQALADALASADAKTKANQNPICLDAIPTCLCVGAAYSATIRTAGPSQALTWTVSGSVPPGLTVHVGTSASLVIDGTPTTYGNYTFAITATNASGGFMSKNYTLSIVQISTASLPGFALGIPYSFQMVAVGGSGGYTWAITSGSLPPGVTMSASGLISGTPTGQPSNPITFSVVDTTCETLPPIPPQPQVALSTVSTTQSPVVIGYSEFPSGPPSIPPKKYHNVAWSGSSEQQLWYQGVQIGGARYDFAGNDTIDTHGNITSNHTKVLNLMCNGAQNRAAIIGGTSSAYPNYNNACSFLGYFGTNAVALSTPCLINPTELCMSSNLPYAAVGNFAAVTPFSAPQADLIGLWGTNALGFTEQTSFIGTALVTFPSNTQGVSTDNGNKVVPMSPYAIPLLNPGAIGPVTTGLYLESFSSLVTPCGNVPRPPDWNVAAQIIWINSFSAVLSDEYTDAEALSNAPITTGNSNTAVNGMRTTGFNSTFTNVAFSLNCTNLLPGVSYTATVELQNLTTGVPTLKTYTFTAVTSVNTINDSIPTPLVGQSVQVRSAKIGITQ